MSISVLLCLCCSTDCPKLKNIELNLKKNKKKTRCQKHYASGASFFYFYFFFFFKKVPYNNIECLIKALFAVSVSTVCSWPSCQGALSISEKQTQFCISVFLSGWCFCVEWDSWSFNSNCSLSLCPLCLLFLSPHSGAGGARWPEWENLEDHRLWPGQRVAPDHQDECSRDLCLDGPRGHQALPLL